MPLFDTPLDPRYRLDPYGRRQAGATGDWEMPPPVTPGNNPYALPAGSASLVGGVHRAGGAPRVDLMGGGAQTAFGGSAPDFTQAAQIGWLRGGPQMQFSQTGGGGSNPAITTSARMGGGGARTPRPGSMAGDIDPATGQPISSAPAADPNAYSPGVSGTMPVTPPAPQSGPAGPTAADREQDWNDQRTALLNYQMGLGETGFAADEANQQQAYGKDIGAGARIKGNSVVNNLTRALGGVGEAYYAQEAKKGRDTLKEQVKQLREEAKARFAEVEERRKGGKAKPSEADAKGEIEKGWGEGSYRSAAPSFLDPEDLI